MSEPEVSYPLSVVQGWRDERATLLEAAQTFIRNRGHHEDAHVYDPTIQHCQRCETAYIEAEAVFDKVVECLATGGAPPATQPEDVMGLRFDAAERKREMEEQDQIAESSEALRRATGGAPPITQEQVADKERWPSVVQARECGCVNCLERLREWGLGATGGAPAQEKEDPYPRLLAAAVADRDAHPERYYQIETWLVWTNEGGGSWWKPARCGYTRDVAQAGRYSRAEAMAICKLRSRRDDGVPPELMVPSPEMLAALEKEGA